MKAIDQDSAETSADQSPTLIDCLQCGYDLGDGSAARCPECGRERLDSDQQVRASRALMSDGGTVGIPLLACFGALVASLILAAAGGAPALVWLFFIAPALLAPLLMGTAILATTSALLVPRHHRLFAFRASIPTIPRLALWLTVPVGSTMIGVLMNTELRKWPYVPLPAVLVLPPVLFVAVCIVCFPLWRRRFRRGQQRLGIALTHRAELVIYIGASFAALIGPILLCLFWASVVAR